jgi:hypothetical protein
MEDVWFSSALWVRISRSSGDFSLANRYGTIRQPPASYYITTLAYQLLMETFFIGSMEGTISCPRYNASQPHTL